MIVSAIDLPIEKAPPMPVKDYRLYAARAEAAREEQATEELPPPYTQQPLNSSLGPGERRFEVVSQSSSPPSSRSSPRSPRPQRARTPSPPRAVPSPDAFKPPHSATQTHPRVRRERSAPAIGKAHSSVPHSPVPPLPPQPTHAHSFPFPAQGLPEHPSSPPPTAALFKFKTAQKVNHYEVFSKSDPLNATFIIDPALPGTELKTPRALRKQREAVWGKGAKAQVMNASYRTRDAPVNLDLAILAMERRSSPTSRRVPARVLVQTKSGRIDMHVYEIQELSRSLDLHVETSSGKIVLFLPPTFDGPLVFQTRTASALRFLPAFAARARTIRTTDAETVVFCEPPLPAHPSVTAPRARTVSQFGVGTGPNSATGKSKVKSKGKKGKKGKGEEEEEEQSDRALVKSRGKEIVVGVCGLDVLEEPKRSPGFFGTLGKLFGGGGGKEKGRVKTFSEGEVVLWDEGGASTSDGRAVT